MWSQNHFAQVIFGIVDNQILTNETLIVGLAIKEAQTKETHFIFYQSWNLFYLSMRIKPKIAVFFQFLLKFVFGRIGWIVQACGSTLCGAA